MATRFLIATHGSFAQGIRDSMRLLVGNHAEIDVINAFVDESNLKETVQSYLASVPLQDTLVVMTDLMTGSVNQQFMPYIKTRDIQLITGINLAVVLELTLSSDPLTPEAIQRIVDMAKEQIQYVNPLVEAYQAFPENPEQDLFE